jgi:hypothetical protein
MRRNGSASNCTCLAPPSEAEHGAGAGYDSLTMSEEEDDVDDLPGTPRLGVTFKPGDLVVTARSALRIQRVLGIQPSRVGGKLRPDMPLLVTEDAWQIDAIPNPSRPPRPAAAWSFRRVHKQELLDCIARMQVLADALDE